MKILITCDIDDASNLMAGIRTVMQITGRDFNIELIADPLPTVQAVKRGRGPTVQYRAVAASSALQALGETTVEGIIFEHLLTHGPRTVRQLHEEKGFKIKALESSIHRLKHMSLVEPVSLTAAAAPEVTSRLDV